MEHPTAGVIIPDMTEHRSVGNRDYSEVSRESVDEAVRIIPKILCLLVIAHSASTEDTFFSFLT